MIEMHSVVNKANSIWMCFFFAFFIVRCIQCAPLFGTSEVHTLHCCIGETYVLHMNINVYNKVPTAHGKMMDKGASMRGYDRQFSGNYGRIHVLVSRRDALPCHTEGWSQKYPLPIDDGPKFYADTHTHKHIHMHTKMTDGIPQLHSYKIYIYAQHSLFMSRT